MSYRLRVQTMIGPLVAEVQVPELVDEAQRFETYDEALDAEVALFHHPRFAVARAQMPEILVDIVEVA